MKTDRSKNEKVRLIFQNRVAIITPLSVVNSYQILNILSGMDGRDHVCIPLKKPVVSERLKIKF